MPTSFTVASHPVETPEPGDTQEVQRAQVCPTGGRTSRALGRLTNVADGSEPELETAKDIAMALSRSECRFHSIIVLALP